MLPVSINVAMITPWPSSSYTLASAPFTNPRLLSKLRVRRSNTPSLATIGIFDFEVGSQVYPHFSNSSCVIFSTRSAASHTSAAPLFVHVSHAKCLPVSFASFIPCFTEASKLYPLQWRSSKYSRMTDFGGCSHRYFFRTRVLYISPMI